MRDDDLRAAMSFFAERLRDADIDETRLLRWTRIKLRNDIRATAQLMLAVGYRPTYIRYFLRYHIPTINESAAVGERYIDPGAAPEARLGLCWRLDDAVLTVYTDLHAAAKRLKQPYRDLAAVCLRWGYVHETVVQLLAKTLERKAKDVVED
jgi:hypothetical protein